jgi:hypothetical protein
LKKGERDRGVLEKLGKTRGIVLAGTFTDRKKRKFNLYRFHNPAGKLKAEKRRR